MWLETVIKSEREVNRDGLVLIEDIMRERFVVNRITDFYPVIERVQEIVDKRINKTIEVHIPKLTKLREKYFFDIRSHISGRSKVKWFYHKWYCKGTKLETRKEGTWFALKIKPCK